MKNQKNFIFSIIFILGISLSSAFFISTKVYDSYWQEMMLKMNEFLGDRNINLVDYTQKVKESKNTFNNLNNQVWVLAKKNNKFNTILDKIYFDDNFIGTAMVVTSDGWLLTNNNLNSYNAKDLVLINENNEIINVEEVIQDSILNIFYLKIKNVNLDPVAIADSSILEVGESVYAIQPNFYNYQNEVFGNSIRNLHARIINKKADLIYSPEDIVIYGVLNNDLNLNLPIFNKQSQFIGFSSSDKNSKKTYLLPSKYVKYSLTNLFNNDSIIPYPSIGIKYLDLSEIILYSDFPSFGVLVYATEINSIFKKDDVITHIEGEQINGVRSLNTLLLDYKIGQEIEIEFLRNEEIFKEKVLIKNLKDVKI